MHIHTQIIKTRRNLQQTTKDKQTKIKDRILTLPRRPGNMKIPNTLRNPATINLSYQLSLKSDEQNNRQQRQSGLKSWGWSWIRTKNSRLFLKIFDFTFTAKNCHLFSIFKLEQVILLCRIDYDNISRLPATSLRPREPPIQNLGVATTPTPRIDACDNSGHQAPLGS